MLKNLGSNSFDFCVLNRLFSDLIKHLRSFSNPVMYVAQIVHLLGIEAKPVKLQQVELLNISKFWPTLNTSHNSPHFPSAMTILKILLSVPPSPSPSPPILNWIMVKLKICLALHHSDISQALRMDWNGFPALWSLCAEQSEGGTFQIIFDVSRERFVPSNIGFRISNKWPGDHGKYRLTREMEIFHWVWLHNITFAAMCAI